MAQKGSNLVNPKKGIICVGFPFSECEPDIASFAISRLVLPLRTIKVSMLQLFPNLMSVLRLSPTMRNLDRGASYSLGCSLRIMSKIYGLGLPITSGSM